MFLRILTVGLMVAAAGCASREKKTSALDTLQDRKAVTDHTDGLLNNTSKTLADFNNKLESLKRDAAESKQFRNRTDYNSVLNELQLAVQRSQLEVRQQQLANRDAWNRLESRVNRAVDGAPPAEFRSEDTLQSE